MSQPLLFRSFLRRSPLARSLFVALWLLGGPLPAATITVDSAASNDVDDALCTLREAIVAANLDVAYHGCAAGSGFDQVEFDLPAGSTITGAGVALPTVTGPLALLGPGASELTIDGADLQPLFLVDSPAGGVGFEIDDLTLTNGHALNFAANQGGAVTVRDGDTGVFRRVVFRDNASAVGGGAILLAGVFGAPANATVEDCLFEANAGGIAGGGAILLDKSTLAVRRSTFVLNQTDAEPAGGQAWGGGAVNSRDSTLTVRTSTFSDNWTAGSGGAILVFSNDPTIPDTFVLTDSTVFENVGDGDGDDLGNIGGVAIGAIPGHVVDIRLQNNLIAENGDFGATVWPDIYVTGAGITTLGFNLVGANPDMTTWFPTGNPNANGDYVGTLAAPLVPSLSALDDFGGPTPVHLPVPGPGGLVIDRGNCWFEGSDQRGFVDAVSGSRPVNDPVAPNVPGGDLCDIGAAESGAVAPSAPDLPFLDGFEDGTTSRWSSAVGG